MASHVLGFVDVDDKGLGGIEHEYDELIRSKGEKIVVMADARALDFDGEGSRQNRGVNIVLTIDEKIQYIAERELAPLLKSLHAPAGTVIVQNPNTGAILALANWPKFNPNSAAGCFRRRPHQSRNQRYLRARFDLQVGYAWRCI